MTTSHTQPAVRTRLEARILRMRDLLERARKDGDQLFIDMAEADLNALLDQLPRTKPTAQEPQCPN